MKEQIQELLQDLTKIRFKEVSSRDIEKLRTIENYSREEVQLIARTLEEVSEEVKFEFRLRHFIDVINDGDRTLQYKLSYLKANYPGKYKKLEDEISNLRQHMHENLKSSSRNY